MKLMAPSCFFKDAFSHFYDDFAQHDAKNAAYYQSGKMDFSGYVQRLLDESQGINLHKDYVPCNHFWLIHQDVMIGVIRIRHRIDNDFLTLEAGHIGYDIAPSFRGQGYGKKMLALALPHAKALAITQALVTADESNIASRKVIEANNGQLENIVMGKVFNWPLARYWVNCE